MLKKIKHLSLAVPLIVGAISVQAKPLSLERIFDDPSLSGKSPVQLKFSPDGSRVTYLQGKTDDYNRYDLWEYNLDDNTNRVLVDSAELFSGPENLSDEEKARRERQRIFGKGILEYTWSTDGKALLFPLNGDLYYYDLASAKSKKLTNTEAFETDARFSPKGNYVSFIREQNLYALELHSGKEIQLSQDGGGVIKNGMAEFVAQEEMSRMTGYWWSGDETKIAYTRVDESPVKEAIRNEIYADEVKLFNQRYPFTGTDNVKIQLGVVKLNDQKVDWIDLGKNQDIYIARAKWLKDSKTLSYQWQNRSQQTLELRFYDSESKKQKVALTENSDTWINLHFDLVFLKDKKHFVWASERDGFKHLYLYRTNGQLVRQITSGDWAVDSLKGVDEKKGIVYFAGRKDTPLESHLYSAPLFKKGDSKRITEKGQYHNVVLAKDSKTFIDTSSSVNKPNSAALRKVNGEFITWLEENKLDNNHPLTPYLSNLAKPEYGTIKAEDGQIMHYRLFKPTNMSAGKKHPVIVNVYGGPHAQRVTNSWRSKNLYFQYMAQQGYVIFQLDNRGSYNRGKKFEDAIYKNLGDVEVADQIKGVEFLRTLDYVDAKRIGIYGHSYGGYMALMTMFKAGDYFNAGVSGAPVTDWALYDTHYTERYLGHPDTNAKGYEASAVFPYTDGLKGPLMIYHGMADDNVLFTHATKLFKQLQDSEKQFEMMTYPGSKHSLRGKQVQTHLHQTITNFFNRHFDVK
ncbi:MULTISPECIES: DPP IV N-terminal domain-containing protein [unclassified Pseudoalteromonas]|uniref:S9 family peptidase n=1 Tax=unclassified Pseudoalteromonas TaxID=194690 RepID=UPI00073040DA|nr:MULTISPECIES: DPP IV N-terminal domain-containing protein [unclassified Pseudoalteromonas]KTD97937.1 peptidase S9 [Pseudoalteromonas sp. H71]TMN84347.1 S9 family peptidase [Pseudoalteromonas sp. S410]TMN88656.1 S9 family peptidase [Pseudoalteromonas sp. S408]TMN95711.1 S9 family peptidase [Pseudoalteromonas sp. S407]TMN98211.1 S9 family peptidase [Pseudoalteromonas sp. S409]